jgi:hypothetical protein
MGYLDLLFLGAMVMETVPISKVLPSNCLGYPFQNNYYLGGGYRSSDQLVQIMSCPMCVKNPSPHNYSGNNSGFTRSGNFGIGLGKCLILAKIREKSRNSEFSGQGYMN